MDVHDPVIDVHNCIIGSSNSILISIIAEPHVPMMM